jgi:hypothetical protein
MRGGVPSNRDRFGEASHWKLAARYDDVEIQKYFSKRVEPN